MRYNLDKAGSEQYSNFHYETINIGMTVAIVGIAIMGYFAVSQLDVKSADIQEPSTLEICITD